MFIFVTLSTPVNVTAIVINTAKIKMICKLSDNESLIYFDEDNIKVTHSINELYDKLTRPVKPDSSLC